MSPVLPIPDPAYNSFPVIDFPEVLKYNFNDESPERQDIREMV